MTSFSERMREAQEEAERPCIVCGWAYCPKRERNGVYDKVAPLFYCALPMGPMNLCRWCARRPTVRQAIDQDRALIDVVMRGWR